MLARPIHVMTALLIATPFLFVVPDARSMELPEGMKVTVIVEYPSDAPGLEKVRLLKVLMQPGTGWTKVKQVREEYCTLEKGTLTSTDYTVNTTTVYSIGSFWSPRKDHIYTTFNTGDDEVVMWAFQLIEEDPTESNKIK